MHHAKENPFRGDMNFLHGLQELSADEETVYAGLGREFLSVIETTDMQKVYKMPVLYSFFNCGKVRLAVTESDVLKSWKEFFDTGTNWKDFAEEMTFEDYKKMMDRQHLSKAKSMPIRFLKVSGKGFFVEREGYALAIREELANVAKNAAFREQMGDILAWMNSKLYPRAQKFSRFIGARGLLLKAKIILENGWLILKGKP